MRPAPYVRKCSFMKITSNSKKKNFTSLEIEVLLSEIYKVKWISVSVCGVAVLTCFTFAEAQLVVI